MAAPSPASLRDLYVPPSNAWSFVPPALAPENSTAAGHPPLSGPSSSAHQWSTRTAPSNPLFDLGSSLAGDDSGLDVASLAKELLASLLLQYATNALAQPWEVGKTLLQVQWVPRDTGDVVHDGADPVDDEGELSDSSNDDSYFADPSAEKPPKPLRAADEQGYIIRQSVLEEGTQPDYVIPVGSADGTWGMMKKVAGFRTEGWLALWKGLFTTAVQNALSAALQPLIYSLLQSIFSPLSPSLSSLGTPSVLLPVASQVLTGFLLSPLDLIRTRLIVQSSVPRHRTYSGPLDALRQILAHEGGLRGAYLHPHLLIPTLLDSTLHALVPLTLPGLVAAQLGLGAHITPETHPVQWNVAELLGGVLGSLVLLPFETVRRRLQVQTRGTARPIKACVELRPAPYNGMVDAFWHILTEERSDLPLKPHRRHRGRRSDAAGGKGKGKGKGRARADAGEDEDEEGAGAGESESWWRHTGLGQLYRGLGMRVGASVVVFVLALVGSPDESNGGWAEL
ncbi:mitochondrial carrier [Trametes coccinea BRFM310]|uniref:Mitochondrial carrier n=1 Tax=Trametes coccinea (strain BRFM310) TaxID=1353009 RepID=A0A1Y2IXQ1_TRAC3|nr:mitochondrial carrier [Trametes coccinea BRFM310]